jgi:hypothetical protein
MGVALIAVTAPLFRLKTNRFTNVLITLAVLVTGAGLGFGAHHELDDALMKLTVPRIKNMQILPARRSCGACWPTSTAFPPNNSHRSFPP